ncbi:MAG: hypothetical protein NZ805_16340, partial [Armatimonadetes bacterium]|nr:hypothetical protein [Armatimonadota bacterium]
MRWDDLLILIGVLVMLLYSEVVGQLVLLFVLVFKAISALVNQWRTTKPLLRLLKSLKNPEQKAEVFQQVKDGEGITTLLLKGLDLRLSLSFSERAQVIETVEQLRLKEATQPLIKLLKGFPMWEEIH